MNEYKKVAEMRKMLKEKELHEKRKMMLILK